MESSYVSPPLPWLRGWCESGVQNEAHKKPLYDRLHGGESGVDPMIAFVRALRKGAEAKPSFFASRVKTTPCTGGDTEGEGQANKSSDYVTKLTLNNNKKG